MPIQFRTVFTTHVSLHDKKMLICHGATRGRDVARRRLAKNAFRSLHQTQNPNVQTTLTTVSVRKALSVQPMA
ncbi:hypothetical protein GGQ85_003150 [Nitrobacter vulgaris]|nr:hypothetical protein [Nitrobacter vulgaris]